MDRSVFISYSHNDRSAVRRDAELLRAGGVQIFIDVTDIAYGERWRDVLMQALAQCERVLVFWSRAAQLSEWVEREWRTALQLGKKIVPTLLDATPLPTELAEFQAVKRFRRAARPPQATAPVRPAPMAAGADEELPRTFIRPGVKRPASPASPLPQPPEPLAPPAPRSATPGIAVGLGLGAVAVLGAVAWFAWRPTGGSSTLPMPPLPASAASAPTPYGLESASTPSIALFGAVALLVLAAWLWLRRRRSVAPAAATVAAPPARTAAPPDFANTAAGVTFTDEEDVQDGDFVGAVFSA